MVYDSFWGEVGARNGWVKWKFGQLNYRVYPNVFSLTSRILRSKRAYYSICAAKYFLASYN